MKSGELTLVIVLALAMHLLVPDSAKPLLGWICGLAVVGLFLHGMLTEFRQKP